jgi:hypothetical protein
MKRTHRPRLAPPPRRQLGGRLSSPTDSACATTAVATSTASIRPALPLKLVPHLRQITIKLERRRIIQSAKEKT